MIDPNFEVNLFIMATLQERLQMKRVPIDKWSIKEQLCLASAVSRSGDQNWMSVSRALKPFAEANRPPDWFSQKNCAAQYGLLLENVETPKRKKRVSGSVSDVLETPQEVILKKLTDARKAELSKKMEEEKREYLKLQGEMEMIRNGTATEEMIEKWSKEIEEEEKQKAQDAVTHAQWLKQREERKLEVERAFRPLMKVTTASPGQKRKASESIDSIESIEEPVTPTSETSKPALSPLLTSLLKTPAHVPNATSSILHSAITNQRGTSTSPTIASLLNTTTTVPVSPSLQQLVSTAISQEPATAPQPTIIKTEPIEVLNTSTEDPDLVKQVADEISLLESSKSEKNIVSIKNDDVLGFTSSATKTELNTEPPKTEEKPIKIEPIEIDDKPEENKTPEIEVKAETTEDAVIEEVPEQLDVYDFDNNSKTSSEEITSKDTNTDTTEPENDESNDKTIEPELPPIEIKDEPLSPVETKPKKDVPGSVEIVEVLVDDDDSDKEMNKKVSEIKRDMIQNKDRLKELENASKDTVYAPKEKIVQEEKIAVKKETTVYDEYDFDDVKKPDDKSTEEKAAASANIDLELPDSSRKSTFTPELDTFYDDLNIEVTKLDKSGKAKRDYSRTKKKEDKDIDILLAVEKVVNTDLEENDAMEETSSEKDSQDSDKKSDHGKYQVTPHTRRFLKLECPFALLKLRSLPKINKELIFYVRFFNSLD